MDIAYLRRRVLCVVACISLFGTLCIILIEFSSKEIDFDCEGSYKAGGEIISETIHIKYTQYSWWIRVFSNVDGELVAEAPNLMPKKYDVIFSDGNVLFYNYNSIKREHMLSGLYSKESKRIGLNLGEREFNGECIIAMDP
jgi:hypothetical protein